MDSPPAPPTGFDFLYPSPPVLALTLLLIFLTPIFLHFIVFRQRSSHTLPTFLLLGPSSSGKTSLTTTFATPHSPETRTSQAPLSLEATIPASLCASASFRSRNDPSLIKGEVKFTLQDTPGHGKLRDRAVELISADTKGVVFVVDSSAQGWHDAGEYLHAVLLRVQKVAAKRKDPNALFPVLVACNKSDLFTALPATRVRALLDRKSVV